MDGRVGGWTDGWMDGRDEERRKEVLLILKLGRFGLTTASVPQRDDERKERNEVRKERAVKSPAKHLPHACAHAHTRPTYCTCLATVTDQSYTVVILSQG